MNTKQTTTSKVNTRLLAILTALCLMLGIAPIVVLAEDYGMQGGSHKLQMIEPSAITVTSTTDTDYYNTLDNPVALTNGTASFKFKMDAFGGAISNTTSMQSRVNGAVTFTDAEGNAVAGATKTVTALDTSEKTFDLAIGGLSEDTSYILTFTSSFAAGGGNWAIGKNIHFNFTTAALAHTHIEEAIAAVAPTCTEPGKTEGTKCSECGEILVAPQDVPALGHDYVNGVCTRCGAEETTPEPDPETPAEGTLVNYTDEQATSPQGTVFNIKFTYIDGEMAQTDVPLYKVGDNRYRIDGLLDSEGIFRGTFKFRNAYGGRNHSNFYAGIYADPADLSEVASGEPVELVGRNFETDTMFAIDPSGLLPGTTYYFVIKANTANGNQNFGSDVVFELKTKGEAPVPVPELVSSKGKDLIAKTYTNLELKNAPGEGYEYKFIVYNETTNQWYKLQDYSDLTTFTWYTGPAGVKNLYVDIRNKNDETDVTRVALTGVNVTDSGLKATLAIEPTGELAKETQAKLTATAENGTAPYEYKFIVFNATTNQWYKLKDFGPESEFDWYTGPAGTKTLYVDVKDANGVVVRQPLENIVVK